MTTTPNLDTIYTGDTLSILKTWPDGFVNTCVTSPPYYGLRDYGTSTWVGGDASHSHDRVPARNGRGGSGPGSKNTATAFPTDLPADLCSCGAKRVDLQFGQEKTPEAYVAKMVELFREVRRVLRDDGTLWLNLGDSYAANRSYQVPSTKGGLKHAPAQAVGGSKVPAGLKPKDLIGIPWRVAFALQADGWYLRSDIIWEKPNQMPQSVKDRVTTSHEYIFMLSKSARYYFDSKSIREPAGDWGTHTSKKKGSFNGKTGSAAFRAIVKERRKRSVWRVNTKAYRGAHFATFPEQLITPCVLAGSPAGG